jgi:DNA-binding transcriptional MerR regulator
VSVRTLRKDDRLGPPRPTSRTGARYRQYGRQDALRHLQILLFRELDTPLTRIRAMLESPAFGRVEALRSCGRLQLAAPAGCASSRMIGP